MESRLNLAAVLVIETTDAYWLYDDVDALVAAFSEESPTPSSPAETDSEFTEQELQVIDELVAELMATEGYSDDELLAITYLEDTTSDELIASGFFEDALFDEFSSGFDAFVDFGEDFGAVDFVDAADELVADVGDLAQLPGAAGNDSLSLDIEEAVADARSQVRAATERLTANVATTSADATADQSLATRNVARLEKGDAQGDVAIPPAKLANSETTASASAVVAAAIATNPVVRAMAMTQPMTSAAQFVLPFAKFATTGLVATGIVTELRSATHAIPTDSSATNDRSTTPAENSDGPSYSQIMALFGAGGLAAAHWWNTTRERESASPPATHRRPGRRPQRTTM